MADYKHKFNFSDLPQQREVPSAVFGQLKKD